MSPQFILAIAANFFLTATLSSEEILIQRISFFTFKAPFFPTQIFVQSGAEQFTEIQLQGANTTELVNIVNKEGSIAIYGSPSTNAEGKQRYPIIGQIKVDPGWKKVFGVLSGFKEGDGVLYQGRSFEISDLNFPDGSLKFANLSDSSVRGFIDDKQVFFEPGEIRTIDLKSQKEGALVDVVFQYQSPKNRKWVRMVATRWSIKKNGRSLMLAFKDSTSKKMRTRTIPIRGEKPETP